MRTLYIGGQRRRTNGIGWKFFVFFIVFLVMAVGILKVSAPMIVERWINEKGKGEHGYAFSVRDIDLSITQGEMVLKDLKVFNPQTSTDLIEAPTVTLQVNWADIIQQDKKVKLIADKIDVILSKDFSSEIDRIKALNEKYKEKPYLNELEGTVGKLNIIEQKEDLSRKVIELSDVNLKIKEVALLSINNKTQFTFTSNVVDGGKLQLIGKTMNEVDGATPWNITGTMKNVPTDIFNKIAGDKLPFSFNESRVNAEISAQSEKGEIKGEIVPDVKRLNLIVEKPGVPTQSIARALNEDLSFALPFTLKDELNVQYADVYRKLKNYRKYPAASEAPAKENLQVSQNDKSSKSSFWPF